MEEQTIMKQADDSAGFWGGEGVVATAFKKLNCLQFPKHRYLTRKINFVGSWNSCLLDVNNS